MGTGAVAAEAADAVPLIDTDACARRLECLRIAGSHVSMTGAGKSVEEIARRYLKFVEQGKFGDQS